MTFNQRRISPDLLCVLALIALWLLFFWRLITPNPANALSIREGDFSGQFVAWAGYQGARQHAGEGIPSLPIHNPAYSIRRAS
jgi:hypothetical protein